MLLLRHLESISSGSGGIARIEQRVSTVAEVPSQPVRAARRFYRPELDALRFFAFLMVFFHHWFAGLTGLAEDFRCAMAFGVCLFFLLSAFLITDLLNIEESATGSIHLRSFYVRRILRIWPLFFGLLLVDFVYPHHVHPHAFTFGRLVANLLLVGNWYVFFHGFSWTLSTPLWSIAVEEQFYVLWPLMRRQLARIGALVFAGAVFATAYVALFWLCRHHDDIGVKVWVNSFVQFQFFSVGTFLAFRFGRGNPTFAAWQRILICIAGLAFVCAAQVLFHVKESDSPLGFFTAAAGYLCVCAGCTLLFLSFLGASGLGRYRWLLYLGKISYGLYAFHYISLQICGEFVYRLTHRAPMATIQSKALYFVISMGMTVSLAALSYRFYEKPFLKLKTRFETVRTRPV